MASQIVVGGFVPQLLETFRRVLLSFGRRVGVGYSCFQPANHMACIFFCEKKKEDQTRVLPSKR